MQQINYRLADPDPVFPVGTLSLPAAPVDIAMTSITSSIIGSACCRTVSMQSCNDGPRLEPSSVTPMRRSKNFFIKHFQRLKLP